MNKTDTIQNIYRGLYKIQLIDCLKRLKSCKIAVINDFLLQHLTVLASQSDIFEVPVPYIHGSSYDEPIYNDLIRFGFITKDSVKSDMTDYYIRCSLTPLGREFVNKIPNLKAVSRSAFKHYHALTRIGDYIYLFLVTIIILIGFFVAPLTAFASLGHISLSRASMCGGMILFYFLIALWILLFICLSIHIHKYNDMDLAPDNLRIDHHYLQDFMTSGYLIRSLQTDLKPVRESILLKFIWKHLNYYSYRLLQDSWSEQDLIKMINDQMFPFDV